ncbi:hypothetical protein SCOCK_920003 [Actinacidiphila cocklensis]|uniref:Uncharacterized protein n=1 Tax=Actinacidiphila cocklensis TaxID=887465 RepID=A0A9W4EBW7_9ACTN|nr:hypothetical protein SCOCK_920003 [Actinacidiphila cocklensis]
MKPARGSWGRNCATSHPPGEGPGTRRPPAPEGPASGHPEQGLAGSSGPGREAGHRSGHPVERQLGTEPDPDGPGRHEAENVNPARGKPPGMRTGQQRAVVPQHGNPPHEQLVHRDVDGCVPRQVPVDGQPPVRREQRHVRGPRRTPDGIEDDVEAVVPERAGEHVPGDDPVVAEPLRVRRPHGAAHHPHHRRGARRAGELRGERTDTARGRVDEHPLPLPHPPHPLDQVVRGRPRPPQPCGVPQRCRPDAERQHGGRDDDFRAGPALDEGDDLLPDPLRRDPLPDCDDPPRGLETGHEGPRQRYVPVPHQDVPPLHPRVGDAYGHLARSRHGFRHILDAVLPDPVQHDSLHAHSSLR